MTIILFLILVLAVWLVFLFMPRPAEVWLNETPGTLDLYDAPFEDTLYYCHGDWENYPESLYTPDDFESGRVREAPVLLDSEDYKRIEYATHRLEVGLRPGVTYALSLKSSDYSMRIYINGEETDTVGQPGDSRETTIPRTAERTYFFTPETDTTILVVQAANWVHKEGAYSPNFYVGTPENILARHDYNLVMTFLITGGLLTAFLYHLGLFVLNRSRKPVLVFSLCCLLLALMTNKLVPLFFSEYNWFIAIGLEYIVHFLTFAMLALFLDLLFPRLYHRIVARVYYILAGGFILLTFLLPTEIYTRLLIIFEGVSVLMIIYTLVRLALQLREKRLQNLLAFIGVFLVCLFGLNDILQQNGLAFLGSIAGQAFSTPIAMLFFVFCYGLVISIDYSETEQRMQLAEQMVRQAEERYTFLLEKQSDTSAHARPSDYKLSQRETDVLWLLLDGRTRQEVSELLNISMGSVNTYCSRIYQKTGCSNMGGLLRLFGLPAK